MIKQFAPTVAIVAALLAGAALPAIAAEAAVGQKASDTYYWLHPKLGFVKVDRATGAIVRSQRKAVEQPKADDRAEPPRDGLDPKDKARGSR